MKNNYLIIFGILIIVINLLISGLNDKTQIKALDLFMLSNLAYAQGEGPGGGGDLNICYVSMIPQPGSRALECNSPCCYRNDMTGIQPDHTCSGSLQQC